MVEFVDGGDVVLVVDGGEVIELSFSILKNGDEDNAMDSLGEALGDACTVLVLDAVLLLDVLFKPPFRNGELARAIDNLGDALGVTVGCCVL